MNKVKEIVISWWRAENPTPEQSKIAEKRLGMCMKCPSRKESDVFNYVCGECGCPLGKKIFSPVEVGACPLGKWDNLIYE